MKQLFQNRQGAIHSDVLWIYSVILVLNIVAWSSALFVFQNHPLLLGTALLAFGLGLRHAVDADHIAAIDNVTRKLMYDDQRPIAVGFWFALGHSTVVVLVCLAIVWATSAITDYFQDIKEIGGLIGTIVSAGFLFIIAAINAFILRSAFRTWSAFKRTGHYEVEQFDLNASGAGLLTRFLRPVFKLINRSGHMFPLGFLFGLGFDTASEIALLGIAGTQSTAGLSAWTIMIFPLLFSAGMTLVDTLNGHLMIGAYGWAQIQPQRKLYYNMTITLLSVVMALGIGVTEVISLLSSKLNLQGVVVQAADIISVHFAMIGYGVIGLFIVLWTTSMWITKLKPKHV